MARIRKRRKRSLSGLEGLTRKDYVAVAEVLCETNASKKTAEGLANYFAADNPRFRRERFIDAVASCKRRRR